MKPIVVKDEVWKDVPGLEGLYQASTHGRVKSMDRIIRTGWGYKEILRKGKITLGFKTSYGYRKVNITSTPKSTKATYLHRIIAMTFIENINNKPFINHINGIKDDNRVQNLEWVTQSENHKHAYKIGLQVPLKGDDHPRRKLSSLEVLEIKKRVLNGETPYSFAKEYGVSRSNVYHIIRKDTWKGT